MSFIEQKFCSPCIPKACHVPCEKNILMMNPNTPKNCEECPYVPNIITTKPEVKKKIPAADVDLSKTRCLDSSCVLGKVIFQDLADI